MSAGITRKDNMFSVGEVPWHRLGRVIKDAPTIAEGLVAANLGWTVEPRELTYVAGDGLRQPVPNRAIIRTDTQDLLGVVGPNYTPLQNTEAFKFFEPWVESGLVSLETAGSLFSGRRIWVLGKINAEPSEIVQGDIVEKYVLLSNGHDGTMAVRTGFTPIRVVCNNTLSAAHRGNKLLRIFHSKKVSEAVQSAQEIIDVVQRDFLATEDQYKFLAKRSVADQETIRRLVKVVFFKDKADEELEKDRQKAFFDSMVETIKERFEVGLGNDMKGVRGTYWALYDGVTQYLSHEAGTNDERRLNNLWFGGGKKQNDEALELCLEMAGA